MKSADPNASPDHDGPHSRISLQTLIIASLASAAASYAIARIWGPGTLLGAAAAPVIVALVSEGLRHPMRSVTATAQRMPTPHIAAAYRDRPTAAPSSWRSRWRLAIATGLIAFAIIVGIYTVPDLLAGRSITGNGQPTTFFGGSANAEHKATPTTTLTTPAPATITKTAPATITKTAPATPTTTATTTAGVSPTTTAATSTDTLTSNTTPATSTASTTVNSTTTPTTPVP